MSQEFSIGEEWDNRVMNSVDKGSLCGAENRAGWQLITKLRAAQQRLEASEAKLATIEATTLQKALEAVRTTKPPYVQSPQQQARYAAYKEAESAIQSLIDKAK